LDTIIHRQGAACAVFIVLKCLYTGNRGTLEESECEVRIQCFRSRSHEPKELCVISRLSWCAFRLYCR